MEPPSAEDLGAPPDSWEVADLDASVKRLMISSSNKDSSPSSLNPTTSSSSSCSASSQKVGGVSEDALDSVDEFLREALQNPRERLSGEVLILGVIVLFGLMILCPVS